MDQVIDFNKKKDEKHEKEKAQIKENYDYAYICESCGETDDMRLLLGRSNESETFDEFTGFRCMNCGSRVQFWDESEGCIGFLISGDYEEEL